MKTNLMKCGKRFAGGVILILLLLTAQVSWADPAPSTDGTRTLGIDALALGISGLENNETYPGWKTFTIPGVRVYKTVDEKEVRETEKYILTYYIDGKTSGDVVDDDEVTGRRVTIDNATLTKVENSYGYVTVGTKPGTVTVRVVATPKSAYATTEGLTELSNTYSFVIKSVEPTITITPNELTLYVRHGETDKGNGTYDFENVAQKLVLPKAEASITVGSYTQDLTKVYDVTYAVKDGYLEGESGPKHADYLKIVENDGETVATIGSSTYLTAIISNEDAVGNGVEKSNIKANPYADGSKTCKLKVTLTPKSGYSEAGYTTVSKEVNVTIAALNDAEKPKIDFTIAEEGQTLHWVRWNDKNNQKALHYLPIPATVTAAGADLSKHPKLQVNYFAVMDTTYEDRCEWNELIYDRQDLIRKSGLPTKCNLSNTSDTKYMYNYMAPNGVMNTPQLQTNYQGHLRVGMFLSIPADGSAYDLKNWYQYTEEKTLQREGHDYLPATVAALDKDGNAILDSESQPVMVASNGVDIDTDFLRLTDIKYFDIDVMPRVPVLQFEPDPSTMVISTSDTITFNNRFELSGYIDDRNDGTAGELIFGANDGVSDHFSYSFEFAADSGIKVLNWPHGDKMVALDAQGKPVTPLGYDWSNGGMPIYVTYNKKTVRHYGDPDHPETSWYWDEEVDDPESIKESVLDQIVTYKYWSVKGYGTDHLWQIVFTKESKKDESNNPIPYEIKYTLYPYNHARWDVGEASTFTGKYVVETGKTPVLHIDPQELIATVNQKGFVEPDVWVTDLSGTEISHNFDFTYSIAADPNNTGTSVAGDAVGRTFKHEVTIGNAVGDVTVHVIADEKQNAQGDYVGHYTVHRLEGDYIIHIVGGTPLYEIISSHDTDAGNIGADTDEKKYEAAAAKLMGKLHFKQAGTIYSGYTISGVPGLDIRFGKFDGSTTWEVREDTSGDQGSIDNGSDGDGKSNKFITESTPVQLDANGIAEGGSFYEFYAHANGYLTIDARLEAGKEYVLIDYDYPMVKEVVKPETTLKGDYTFKMPLLEDHSYHLYGVTEDSHINMHGLSFEPAFIMSETDKYNGSSEKYPGAEKGSSFLNNFMNVPYIAQEVVKVITYSSDDAAYATIDASTGAVTPQKLTIKRTPNPWVNIRAKVTTDVKSPQGNDIYKWPTYKLYIADIPMYRLGDNKRAQYNFDALKKDGFTTATGDYAENSVIYTPQPGDTVSTYNILTPIRMTYGGWRNSYSGKNDSYEPKTNAEIGGSTANDTRYNKYIDNFTWSNVAKQNPVDENNKGDYKNYLSGASDFSEGYFKNTFTLPAKGAYWRFEPRVSGTVFVYLVQNGICSYTGNPSLLSQSDKTYDGLDWKPLYIVDEAGKPVDVDVSADNEANNLLAGSGDDANMYTEGLIRCNSTDDDIRTYRNRQIEKEDDKIRSGEFCFQWKYKNSKGNYAGFSNDYQGKDSVNFKKEIIAKWSAREAGDVQTVIKDEESHGYTLISKAYVRYAIPVKAGKSYWVFQNASKPNFCGFAFVPQNYLKEPGDADYVSTINVTIGDDKDPDDSSADLTLERSLEKAGGSANVYNKDCNVTYIDRVFENKTWTSLCLPFAVSEYNFKKIFGENAKIVTYEKLTNGNTNIHFIQHNYHMLEAGRPYFIYPDYDDASASKSNIVFEGVTFEENKPAGNDINNAQEKPLIFSSDGFEFVGTYNGEYMPMFSYFIQEKLRRVGKYYPGTSNVRSEGLAIGRYRAYLKNPTSNENFAKIGMSNFEEPFEDIPETQEHTVTRIVGVTDGTILESGGSALLKGIYSIDGKRISENADDVEKLPAGVYIVNGKKFIVK